jgi:hypothetical protein
MEFKMGAGRVYDGCVRSYIYSVRKCCGVGAGARSGREEEKIFETFEGRMRFGGGMSVCTSYIGGISSRNIISRKIIVGDGRVGRVGWTSCSQAG